jgi:hypothetical protein
MKEMVNLLIVGVVVVALLYIIFKTDVKLGLILLGLILMPIGLFLVGATPFVPDELGVFALGGLMVINGLSGSRAPRARVSSSGKFFTD